MTTSPEGDGWWRASDGRWYPPESRPGTMPPPPPSYGQPYGGYPAPFARSVNGLAIASMVLGIVWIYWIGSILALIFGFISHRQINNSEGRQSGAGFAIAGIVLGVVGLGVLVLVLVVVILAHVNAPSGV